MVNQYGHCVSMVNDVIVGEDCGPIGCGGDICYRWGDYTTVDD